MTQQRYIHGTAPAEQERLALLNRLSNAPFLDWLALEEEERVVEVGSGLGLLAAQAAERVPRGRVIGVELAAAQLARAPRGIRNLHFVRGDALRLPLATGGGRGLDRAWCRYLLEHVEDPLAVLREVRRVLRPGGRAHAQENDISLVRFDPPCPAFTRVWQRFGELQSRLGGDAYVGTRLFRLFRAAGFVEVTLDCAPEVHWYGSPRFAGWVENLAGNVKSGAEGLERARLATKEEVAQAVAELEALATRSDGSAFFAWNRATGVNP